MTQKEFQHPVDDRYFEDYTAGSVYEYGSVGISEAEIITFARDYDPQSIHTSPEMAANGPFKGLIASGWQTVGLMMRLFVAHYLSSVASLASPGVDEVRWSKPVRPGDKLRLRVSTLEIRPSRTKPDRGMVISLLEAINQNGENVASFKAMNLIGRRTPTQAAAK